VKLHIIQSCPDDLVFWWQSKVWLKNLQGYGQSHRARLLIWRPFDRIKFERHPRWKELEEEFPEAHFSYYNDTEDILNKFIVPYNYIPLLRPHCLERHFREFPELEEDVIYYCDSDTCFTKKYEFEDLIEGNTCYVSNTSSYLGAEYFDSKIKDVKPDKLEQYKQIDVLQGLGAIFGLTREFLVEHNANTGGAQYLLKGINADFWKSVFAGCLYVKRYLVNINRIYFESEDKGFQSWVADMVSIIYNLWRLKKTVLCSPSMDFCWATDLIEKWNRVNIYHDAGASATSIRSIEGGEHFLFNKRDMKYVNNFTTPFEEDLSFVSKDYCSYNYVKCIQEADPKTGYIVGVDPYQKEPIQIS
jgi:hypothetical protein